jgi:hypothetical protein
VGNSVLVVESKGFKLDGSLVWNQNPRSILWLEPKRAPPRKTTDRSVSLMVVLKVLLSRFELSELANGKVIVGVWRR